MVRWLQKRRQQLPAEIEALQERVAHEANPDLYYQLHNKLTHLQRETEDTAKAEAFLQAVLEQAKHRPGDLEQSVVTRARSLCKHYLE